MDAYLVVGSFVLEGILRTSGFLIAPEGGL
jgi:hypothetical protein